MTLNVISLGAGVQSTTMALMAAAGEITPMPDCAIFADTGWEPKGVYEHLDHLEKALPFPVHRVSAGNLRADTLAGQTTFTGKFAAIPWHIVLPNGTTGIGRRECTLHYKLKPIHRKVVAMHDGKKRKGSTIVWVGISTDEAYRMKPSKVQYITNRWPLIEARIDRNDCRAWLDRRGWNAPKSSCIGCPYRSTAHWRALTPDEVRDAIEVDVAIRHQRAGQQYMHFSKRPLAEVDLRSDAELGQGELLFVNECEGMCGV